MADKYKIAASIDVGSSAVRMKIAQAAGNSMEQIEKGIARIKKLFG